MRRRKSSLQRDGVLRKRTTHHAPRTTKTYAEQRKERMKSSSKNNKNGAKPGMRTTHPATRNTNHERLFGTDGIRGTPGTYPLTDGMIYKIGSGIAKVVAYKSKRAHRHSVVIGKDTRATGVHLETILSNAIASRGIDVVLSGLITTPGLSFMVRHKKADMGIMISASHNKPEDNGIKLFDTDGCKLTPREEALIEDIIFSGFVQTENGEKKHVPGKKYTIKNTQSLYVKFLLSTMGGIDLKGLSVVVDCAHGAASPFAKKVFKTLGAKAITINDKPSGDNINIGGAMDPSELRKVVIENDADIGIALDGDGDRGIIVDEKGKVLDGDHILAVTARYLLQRNRLPQKTIVTTVMSNLGLKIALAGLNGKIIYTQVGDKHVLEAIRKNNLTLGGEQSGHIIYYEHLPTPDGLLTGLQMLKVMKDEGRLLSELAACMERFPQILVNVKVREKRPFEKMAAVSDKLESFNRQLKDEGRILLRYSGTESLARVMVEGKDKDTIREIAEALALEIRKEIGIGAD